MTKKKRGHPDIEEILQRPWCYYCERDFDDLKILISHQKAKHFKCERCGRRLNTAGGLSVHMNQVHKEALTAVENALPNRSDVNIEIFGMEGIPDDVMGAHQQRITTEFFKMEAERRAQTGNPAPGAKPGDQGVKKPKLESSEDLKKRLAEHKAKREAAKAAQNSGGNTPNGAVAGAAGSPMGMANSPAGYSGSPAGQSPFPLPPNSQPYQMPPHVMQQPPHGMQQPPHFSPAGPHPPYGMPPQPQYHAPSPGFGPPQQHFGGPQLNSPGHWTPNNSASSPSQRFSPNTSQGPPQGQPAGPPRQNSLPSAPGLPARPAFNPPSLSKEEMAKMHAGQQPPPHMRYSLPQQGGMPPPGQSQQAEHERISDSVDDLISSVTGQTAAHPPPQSLQEPESAAQQVENAAPPPVEPDAAGQPTVTAEVPETPATPAKTEEPKKKGKKGKTANEAKLLYTDNATSPEEKMANYSKYAFQREEKRETVLGDVGAAVTGIERGEDDVRDAQDKH